MEGEVSRFMKKVKVIKLRWESKHTIIVYKKKSKRGINYMNTIIQSFPMR